MTTAQLGEIASIVRGIAFPKEDKRAEPLPGHVACLRTTNVQRTVEWEDLWFVPEKHVKRDEQLVRSGDILISTANSYELVGKVAPVVGIPHKATLGAFISLIRPNERVEPKFLYYQLAWGKTQSRIRETASTTTNISNVSTKKLLTLEMFTPPLEAQREIVSELEKQISRLDEAVANLQRVKANLKRYKASVLSEFFDSKVSGWRKCQLKTVCQVISGFAFKSTDFSRDGVPVVKIANIGYGEFHWKDQEYLPSSFLESQRAFAIQPCDLLMALTRPITNGTLKVCLYPHDAPVALLNQRVAVLRVGVDLGREFLLLMMQSAAFKNQLQNALSETLQPNLSPVDLKNFEISIPSGPEQARIVAEVDRHLSIIREVEAEVDANLQRAQALRQSTLSSAFSPKP